LFKVAVRHSDNQNGRVGKRKTTAKVAVSCEASTPFNDHPKKVAW